MLLPLVKDRCVDGWLPVIRRNIYFVAACVLSTFLQTLVHIRAEAWRNVRDGSPGDSWYVVNVILLGSVFLAMMPVLRRGPWWQKPFALVFWIYPVLVLGDYIQMSLFILSQP